MQQALRRLQLLQHQEHGRCRLLAREVSAATAALMRWQAYRETVQAAARTDLLTQVDAELARVLSQRQDADNELASQRELLATLDARVTALQQRFLAFVEHWPAAPRASSSVLVWQELQRCEQQFASAERRLPALVAMPSSPLVDAALPAALTEANAVNVTTRSEQGGTSS